MAVGSYAHMTSVYFWYQPPVEGRVPSSSIRCELLPVQTSSSFPSPSTGRPDAGGSPPGGAVSLQGLWLCWPHSSGLWVRPLQCARLLLIPRAQTELERQEPHHTSVPTVWGSQAAGSEDAAPALLRCTTGYEQLCTHTYTNTGDRHSRFWK